MEKVLLRATLCFLVRDKEVLLARKTRHIGEGLWNGYGGGIEEGEFAADAATRELKQESGVIVNVNDLQYSAIIDFHNRKRDGERFTCRVFVFLVRRWTGEVAESSEMASPTWFPFNEIPFDEMMPADRDWLPQVLAGAKITGEASYGPEQKSMDEPFVIHGILPAS